MQSNGRKLEFQDKIATAVYMAILDVKTENEEEYMKRMEYLMNINKVICNYEEIKPILSDFFERKKYLDVFEK